MKKSDLANRLAAEGRQSPGEAADTLDGVVHGILKRLKSGKRVNLPGLGSFTPGARSGFEFQKKPNRKHG